jgi:hypothetical protein
MTDLIHGHVDVVRVDYAGDAIRGDVASGETLIPINDAADFDELGGLVTFDGGASTYPYTILDDGDETGEPVLELTLPIADALADGSPVHIWNLSPVGLVREWVAAIVDDVDGSTIEATIAHALIDQIGEALTGLPGMSVVAERAPDTTEWVLTNILGAAPVTP